MKKIIYITILIIFTPFIFFQVKFALSEHAVKEYLVEKKGINEENIEKLDAIFAKDSKRICLVYVKLKNAEKGEYYYKDFIKNKVILDEIAP
ncbi:hypothetical protein RAH41_21380 [Gottfriedia acidiceleris]|uniref:hypothetical protein n=1 Tax=Gottfriedia acidiceleris TaxID=371036 RepID=UPI002F26C6A0